MFLNILSDKLQGAQCWRESWGRCLIECEEIGENGVERMGSIDVSKKG